jgi:hexosaminidase
LIPWPSEVSVSTGSFVLDESTRIVDEVGLAPWLRGAIRCPLPVGEGGIRLALARSLQPEAYALTVAADGIAVLGGSAAGTFYGLQTLRQLLPPEALRRAGPTSWTVPCGRITDAPRFGWRGVMLDVARHFMPVSDVLRFVDLAAFHKLNVLHLHLTDDQGWRIEVPGRPRLTSVGAWRSESMLGARMHERYDGRPHGGFYTADDLREIVAYAAERQITCVPEVDMPGHMQAAVAAYPELGNGFTGGVRTSWGISRHVLNMAPSTLEFCRDVLSHVCEIFPSPLIGIGGDECPVDEWVDTPGMAPHAVQGWFTGQMAAHLATLGRRVFGWDELLVRGAPPDAVIAAWRGPKPTGVAAQMGHDVISCPDISAYLDYRQSDDPGEPTPVGTKLDLFDMYRFDPVPPGLTSEEQARVLGGQANVWTEHMDSTRTVD